MIFITVGTHEQPFDRLLRCIDKIIEEGYISEEIICQKGFTEYEPKNYASQKLMPYVEIQKNIADARIVVTHGGPASFIAPLSIGKIPIVVPRKKEYNEHVNNHQVDFCREVELRNRNIIVAENDEEILDAIINYDSIISKLNVENYSNNKKFVGDLVKEIESLF
ncbi:MAG: multidrug MFS transporter [Lachnospiraceae bacterium]|nr:multidrug MFS transporter [Lachnospiraceae bacterium]